MDERSVNEPTMDEPTVAESTVELQVLEQELTDPDLERLLLSILLEDRIRVRRGPRAAGTTPSASPPTRLHSGPNCAFMHGGDHEVEDPHSFFFSLLPL